MNKEQAGHILDAYVELECAGGGNKVRQSLREVILDAMTSGNYKTSGYVSTYPSITVPANLTNSPSYPGHTTVTCNGGER